MPALNSVSSKAEMETPSRSYFNNGAAFVQDRPNCFVFKFFCTLLYDDKNKNLSVDKLKSEVSKEININHRSIQIKIVSDFPRLANGKIDYKVMQKKII